MNPYLMLLSLGGGKHWIGGKKQKKQDCSGKGHLLLDKMETSNTSASAFFE